MNNHTQLRKARIALNSEHRPRQLQREPRISRADERQIVEAAHRRNDTSGREELINALNTARRELEFIEARIGKIAPGDHRGYLREIKHGITGLTRALGH
jgi:hypothetical protein